MHFLSLRGGRTASFPNRQLHHHSHPLLAPALLYLQGPRGKHLAPTLPFDHKYILAVPETGQFQGYTAYHKQKTLHDACRREPTSPAR